MIYRIHKNRNLYGNYFLAVEAPGDTEEEVTDDNKQDRDVQVIRIGSDRRQNIRFPKYDDYDDGDDANDTDSDDGAEPVTDDSEITAPEDDASNEDEDTTQSEETDDTAETNDTDQQDDGDATEEGGNDDTNATEPVTDDTDLSPDDADETDGGDAVTDESDVVETDDTSNDEQSAEADDSSETDGPVTDDTPIEGDDSNTNEEPSANSDGVQPNIGGAGTDEKHGIEYDSTRKYNLYKEFMSLYNACENYISKLENILKDDAVQNQIIRIVVSNLRDIRDCIFDYLTIRFQADSYVQALLFHQKVVVSIQLVFNLLTDPDAGKNKRK